MALKSRILGEIMFRLCEKIGREEMVHPSFEMRFHAIRLNGPRGCQQSIRGCEVVSEARCYIPANHSYAKQS